MSVNFNLKPFILMRRSKVASDQIELRVSRRKLMLTTVVAKMQPVSTGVIDDLSWEAENRVIAQAHQAFSHLGVNVEIRNQARVHLWYERKFGGTYSPLKKVTDGIDRYLIRSTCLGIDACTGKLYSTHGLNDLLNNWLKMNELNPRPDLFRAKAASYQARWPWLELVG